MALGFAGRTISLVLERIRGQNGDFGLVGIYDRLQRHATSRNRSRDDRPITISRSNDRHREERCVHTREPHRVLKLTSASQLGHFATKLSPIGVNRGSDLNK